MSDFFIWFLVIFFAVVPLTLFVVFLPFHFYNNAWRAVTWNRPVLSVFSARHYAAGSSRDGYYRLSGITPKVFGVISLLFGLSLQIFALDFAYHFGPDTYVTLSQKIEAWIWLGTLFPISFSSYWVPALSRNAERVWDKEGYELFFWGGLLKIVINKFRRDKKSTARKKRRS